MKRQAELRVTEYFLDNYPEHKQFIMETLDFEGKKPKDLSGTSRITFIVRDFDIVVNQPELNKRFVLLGFTSFGWSVNMKWIFSSFPYSFVKKILVLNSVF